MLVAKPRKYKRPGPKSEAGQSTAWPRCGNSTHSLEDGDEDFALYVERSEHYCEVSNVQEEKLKKSAFITTIGKNAYKKLKDLLLPATPVEKSLVDLVKVLSDHYEPACRIIAERFRFSRRYQAEGETVATFAVALKHMAAKCKYATILDDALRDRFVAGLRNPAIQTGLQKRELSFESAACDFATSLEMAEQESRGFRPGSGTEADVHAIRKTGRKAAFAVKPGKQYEATKKNFSQIQCCATRQDTSVPSGFEWAAERLVQTVKNLVRQLRDKRHSGQARTIQHLLDQFLLRYGNTPCSTTGKNPAHGSLSWAPHMRLSILHSELANRLQPTPSRDQDQGQKKNWKEFDAGERVRVKGIRPGDPHWLQERLFAVSAWQRTQSKWNAKSDSCKLMTLLMQVLLLLYPEQCASLAHL
ncbi:hypothetical protein MTO96_046431 [Rhipicephalus appendiculatus]